MKKIKIEVLTSPIECTKCEHAMKILTDVLKDFKGDVKVEEIDITKHPDAVIKYSVMSTPSIVINGKVAFEGTVNAEKLTKKIEEALR